MGMTDDKSPLDYAEWLAQTVVDFGDSPEFNLGPIDRQTLARALLDVLPVVRAANHLRALREMNAAEYELEHGRARFALDAAIDTMRTRLTDRGK